MMIYSFEQLRHIEQSYLSSKGLASIAREQIRDYIDPPPSIPDIKRVWENAGITHPNGDTDSRFFRRKITTEELDLVIQRMEMYGSLNAAATALGHSQTFVRKRLEELSLLQHVKDLERRIKNP